MLYYIFNFAPHPLYAERQQEVEMNRSTQHDSVRRTTGLAVFTAIIAVLTVLCNFVRFGPFSITLALAPIIIGTAMYGKSAGAYLGGVFGLVVLVTGLLGWDGGTVMLLLSISPVALVAIVMIKGIAAGWVSGLVYRAIERKSEKSAVILAGIVCPVVNTGLFIIGMLIFFFDTLNGWAAAKGQELLLYLIAGLTGVNFLVELAVNLLLSSGICRIIKAGKRM